MYDKVIRNGTVIDGSGEPEAYGSQPPAIGVDFFQGPYIDPDGYDNPKFTGDCAAISSGHNFDDDQMAIKGVNFGISIVDDKRYGMRRLVYHVNCGVAPWCDSQIAPEYYNFLRGIWKDNTIMLYGGNAHVNSGAVGPECNFMFPDDSDPCNWGTNFQPPNGGYNQNGKYWNENTGAPAGNVSVMISDITLLDRLSPRELAPDKTARPAAIERTAAAANAGSKAIFLILKAANDNMNSRPLPMIQGR